MMVEIAKQKTSKKDFIRQQRKKDIARFQDLENENHEIPVNNSMDNNNHHRRRTIINSNFTNSDDGINDDDQYHHR